MEEVSPLRVGLVGCGYHGRSLAEAVTRVPSMRLTAGADPVPAAAASVAALAPDVKTFPSVDAMLVGSEVDAVLIATPHHVLQPAALAAIRAGKHVLAEKPIGLSEAEASEIENAVGQAGVCYLPGYSFRFSFGRAVHELLQAGVVGEIQTLTGTIALPPLDKGWIASPQQGGGPLLYVGSHLVDLTLWYLGDQPIEVRSLLSRRADTGADNVTGFQIRFARGALAQLLVSQSAPSFFFSCDVVGKAGRICLRGWNFLHFEIEVISNTVSTYAQPTIIRPRIARDNIGAMLVPELEEFAQAIRTGRSPSITVADGRAVLRVLDAVVKSADAGRPISLGRK